jgi:DNA-directed RNA polymerase sigma subunit (sigma70/sigma32)
VYMADIARHRLLNRADECRLSRAIDAGQGAAVQLSEGSGLSANERDRLGQVVAAGDNATRTFIQANLRLVELIAKRYRRAA